MMRKLQCRSKSDEDQVDVVVHSGKKVGRTQRAGAKDNRWHRRWRAEAQVAACEVAAAQEPPLAPCA